MRSTFKILSIAGLSFIAGATGNALLGGFSGQSEPSSAHPLTNDGLEKQVRLLTNIQANPAALAGAISAFMVNVDGRREVGELEFVEAIFGRKPYTVPGNPLPGQENWIEAELAARLRELDQVQMRQAYDWYGNVLRQYTQETKSELSITDVGYVVGALAYLTKETQEPKSFELLRDLTNAWAERDFQVKDPEANRLDRQIRQTIGAAYAFGCEVVVPASR